MEPSRQDLEPGQIRDANRAMLVAASQQAGAKVLDLGIARDTEGQVEACLEKALKEQVDVLVTTGNATGHGLSCQASLTCSLPRVKHYLYCISA